MENVKFNQVINTIKKAFTNKWYLQRNDKRLSIVVYWIDLDIARTIKELYEDCLVQSDREYTIAAEVRFKRRINKYYTLCLKVSKNNYKELKCCIGNIPKLRSSKQGREQF